MSDYESRLRRTDPKRIDDWDNKRPDDPYYFNVTNIQHKPGRRVLFAVNLKLVLKYDDPSSRPIVRLYCRSSGFDMETLNEHKEDPDAKIIEDLMRTIKESVRARLKK